MLCIMLFLQADISQTTGTVAQVLNYGHRLSKNKGRQTRTL